jgi:hypothetical protein
MPCSMSTRLIGATPKRSLFSTMNAHTEPVSGGCAGRDLRFDLTKCHGSDMTGAGSSVGAGPSLDCRRRAHHPRDSADLIATAIVDDAKSPKVFRFVVRRCRHPGAVTRQASGSYGSRRRQAQIANRQVLPVIPLGERPGDIPTCDGVLVAYVLALPQDPTAVAHPRTT